MTSAEFDVQFNRLTGHFHLPADASRETIGLDWFKALEHYHVDALERGVTDLIRTAQDRYWPALGRLTTTIKGRLAGMEKYPGKCLTCHGSGWLDSSPFMANGMIYENCCIRCQDCGIPHPSYTAPSHRRELSAQQYRDWMNGDHERQYMPEAQQAKSSAPFDASEMKAMFVRLHVKLFGPAKDDAA